MSIDNVESTWMPEHIATGLTGSMLWSDVTEFFLDIFVTIMLSNSLTFRCKFSSETAIFPLPV